MQVASATGKLLASLKYRNEQVLGVGTGGGGGGRGGGADGGDGGLEQKQPAYPRSLHSNVRLQLGVQSSTLPNWCHVQPHGRSKLEELDTTPSLSV